MDGNQNAIKLTDEEWLDKLTKVDSTSLRALILQQIKTIPSESLKTWWHTALTHAQQSEENSSTQAYLEHTSNVKVPEERVAGKKELLSSATQNPKIIRPRNNKIIT